MESNLDCSLDEGESQPRVLHRKRPRDEGAQLFYSLLVLVVVLPPLWVHSPLVLEHLQVLLSIHRTQRMGKPENPVSVRIL